MDELDGPVSSSSSSDDDDIPVVKRPRMLVANQLHKEGESTKNPAKKKEKNVDDEEEDEDETSDSDSTDLSDFEDDGEGEFDLESSEATDDDDVDSDDDEHESDVEKKEEPPVDEADALIQALRKSKEKRDRQAPPEIVFENNEVVDISFHPNTNVIAAATMDGAITLFEYTNEANKEVGKLDIHKKAVRSLEFDANGERLFSASKDKSLKVTDVVSNECI
jgi:WD40 repeat protein